MKALVNHAETYMRKGLWGEVAKVSGIECVGVVKADPDGKFAAGQTVAAVMGGMRRTINGSYAQFTRVPSSNVVAFQSQLPWHEQEVQLLRQLCVRLACISSVGHSVPDHFRSCRGGHIPGKAREDFPF